MGGLRLLERFKIDDVVGAQFHIQLLGIVVIGITVFIVAWLVWKALDMTLGARVSLQVEQLGQDAGELGMESYPEFILMPEPDYEDEDMDTETAAGR